MNGFTFNASENELFEMAIRVATSDLDEDATTAWIRDRLHPLDSEA